MELFNINGSLVYNMEKATEKGVLAEFYINGSDLDKGIYLLKLRTDGEQIIQRITKL